MCEVSSTPMVRFPYCSGRFCLIDHAHSPKATTCWTRRSSPTSCKQLGTRRVSARKLAGKLADSFLFGPTWASRPIPTCLSTWPTPFSTCSGLRHLTCSLHSFVLACAFSQKRPAAKISATVVLSTSCSHVFTWARSCVKRLSYVELLRVGRSSDPARSASRGGVGYADFTRSRILRWSRVFTKIDKITPQLRHGFSAMHTNVHGSASLDQVSALLRKACRHLPRQRLRLLQQAFVREFRFSEPRTPAPSPWLTAQMPHCFSVRIPQKVFPAREHHMSLESNHNSDGLVRLWE